MPSPLLGRFAAAYDALARALDHGQSAFLLLVRLIWGSQFFITGWGKLGNIDGVTSFFTSLGIPMPGLNAYVVGGTEVLGGLLLFLGLGGRLTPMPLIFSMCVAYLTSDRDAITGSRLPFEIDPFLEAAPFLFLLASLMILVFGPGRFSLDHLIGSWWKAKQKGTP